MVKKQTKEKKFKIKICPTCKSDEVSVVIGKPGMWECHSCKYKGKEIAEKEMSEDEYFAYLDSKGEEFPELTEPETVEEIGAKKSYKDILREKLARGEKI
jgi:hypothetical protein